MLSEIIRDMVPFTTVLAASVFVMSVVTTAYIKHHPSDDAAEEGGEEA